MRWLLVGFVVVLFVGLACEDPSDGDADSDADTDGNADSDAGTDADIARDGDAQLDATDSEEPRISVHITGISFDLATLERRALGSDNWAVTWAADGNLYTTWGDGGGFGGTNDEGRVSLGVARIVGEPTDFIGQNVWGGHETENPTTFDGKSLGLLSLEGVLYMWVGPGSRFEAWETTRLAWSEDLGGNWQQSAEPFFLHTDGLSKPTFLNFGQDYDGARDSNVYVYAPDGSAGAAGPFIDITLARVPVDQIRNHDQYEFFQGLDGRDEPQWGSDAAARVPVLTDTVGGANAPSVVYNAPLGLYLLIKTHGTPTGPHGGLGIYEAENPWGPFSPVLYEDNWMGSEHIGYASFPSNWISPDGTTLWMVFTGWDEDGIAQDAYQHIRVVLTVETTG